MNEKLMYQVRIYLDEDAAVIARRDPADPALAPLRAILDRHGASMKSQFDAFSDYVSEAEARGIDHYPLYKWTKATIEDPAKEAKYLKAFTLYVDGHEVYERDRAEPLAAALKPLVGGGLVTRLSKHDTNPANNPQPPAEYR